MTKKVGEGLGQKVPPATAMTTKGKRPKKPKRFTGCSPFGHGTWAVTIEVGTTVQLVPSASRLLKLHDPRQGGVRQFAAQFYEFIRHNDISALALRRQLEWTGLGQASANAWKIEGVLLMIPDVTTTLFCNSEINSWAKKPGSVVPALKVKTGANANYIFALEAALFQAHLAALGQGSA